MATKSPPDTLVDTPESWLESLGLAKPLYATLPTPGCRNELEKVEGVAKLIGTPLLPWQRYFIRVATEKNPDGSYRYRSIVLTVPRQSGKTTVVRALYATRALMNRSRLSFIFAQTGKDSKARLFELADQLTFSPISKKRKISVRKAAENPGIHFHDTGSRIQSFPPTAESTHGYNFADAFLDEIFAFDDATGSNLLGAIVPAMQTHKDRQIIFVSTKGTPNSTFLNGWLTKGRESLNDPDSDIAYFEWALDDGLDAFDPDNWDFHPGLQGGLISKDDISSALVNLSKGEFTRAFMNRQTETMESVLDLKKWNTLQGVLSVPNRSDVAIGWEVGYSRDKAAICAAWKVGKVTHVKVLMTNSGTSWLQPALEQIAALGPLVIGADKYPQNLVISDSVHADNEDLKLKLLTPEGAKTGAVSFKARIEDGTLLHDGHLALTRAVATAQTRSMGEGWVFSHKSDPELTAASTACRLLDETKAETKPEMYFPED